MSNPKMPQKFAHILYRNGSNPLRYELVKNDFESFTVKEIATGKVLKPIRY